MQVFVVGVLVLPPVPMMIPPVIVKVFWSQSNPSSGMVVPGGNHGTLRNGEGSIGVNAIIVGAVTVGHSAIDHDSIRRVNTIVVGDNFYRSAFNCEGGLAFYTFAILAPGCFNSDVTTSNREISIAFNTFGRGVQTTVYIRFTRGCHIYRAILNRESSVTVNAFTRGAATGDR